MFLNDAENADRRRMTTHPRGNRSFREESVGVVDPEVLPVDRDRDDQRPLRIPRFILRGPDLFCLTMPSLLPRLRNGRPGPVIAAISIRPVIKGGIRIGGAGDRAGCRQCRYPPKLSGRARSPMPANAYHSR